MKHSARGLTLIGHRRIDEDFVEGKPLGDALGQFHVGEDAARRGQIARTLALENPVERGERHLLENLLHRSRDILAPPARGQLLQLGRDFAHPDVGCYLTVPANAIMSQQRPRMDRLAKGGEAQHLAFVPQTAKAEDLGRDGVELAEAIGVVGAAQAARTGLAAEQLPETPADQAASAVKNTVAAAVRGVDQRVVVVGVEQRSQRVREMMIVERYSVRPQALVGEKAPRVERALRMANPLPRHRFQEVAYFVARHGHRPSRTRGVIISRVIAARHRHGFDPSRREPGLREAFGDGFRGKAQAVALYPGDPLLRDRGDQPVVIIESRPGVMRFVNA